MPRKLVITEAGFLKLLKTFISSRLSAEEENLWDKAIRTNPEVQRAWNALDDTLRDNLKWSYEVNKKTGRDNTNIIKLAKKLGLELE